MSLDNFDPDLALKPLKNFQRKTVNYVYERLFETQDNSNRFLVADEVGLGKTMVARGVIVKMIEHLRDSEDRIDIIYICSNQAIAAQNINRLNVLGKADLSLPTRMTLIPLRMRLGSELTQNKVNFISLTPGTTFELKSSTGVAEERAFIYRMLESHVSNSTALKNFLQVHSSDDGWTDQIYWMDLDGVDPKIISAFQNSVLKDKETFKDLERQIYNFFPRRKSYAWDYTNARNKLVAKLRKKLSHICIDALKPNLIILDEFQRFKDLLEGKKDAGRLARELFDYANSDGTSAKTLMLSATPYKMLTLASDDDEAGDHYEEFLKTISFLYGDINGEDIATELKSELKHFRGFLQSLPAKLDDAYQAKSSIQNRLCKVIARTERVSNTSDRNSMVAEKFINVELNSQDLRDAKNLSRLAKVLNARDTTGYWKSAPYLLNFMRDYKFKTIIQTKSAAPDLATLNAFKAVKSTLLVKKHVMGYKKIIPPNGRMRALTDEVFKDGLSNHLWIPPSLPYYGTTDVDKKLTKALIFSQWSVVPDTISALLSYEAERLAGSAKSTKRYSAKSKPLLTFQSGKKGLSGMRPMQLIYPSPALASIVDPLQISLTSKKMLSAEQMKLAAQESLSPYFKKLQKHAEDEFTTRDWEWGMPVAIDGVQKNGATSWLTSPNRFEYLFYDNRSKFDSGFNEHISELRRAINFKDFGALLNSFIKLLANVALGSPAVCALRSLHRLVPELPIDDFNLMDASAKIAWAFRALFNQADSISLLRQEQDGAYWSKVLEFSIEMNLQAMLDEYIHYLVDAEGLTGVSPINKVEGITSALVNAISIRPSQITVDNPKIGRVGVEIKKFKMRGRFAMRLGDYEDDENKTARISSVRDAFNSPFKPFVLATTSIGQEGLDFHPYCYQVYHWNLPSNPVDLEQREGRVHRYKCHAVRLNIAEKQSKHLTSGQSFSGDPWKTMFSLAEADTKNDSGIVPYWVYEGSTKVERRVLSLPYSREVKRLEWLKRSLTIYRLAFGQPRQIDLMDYLTGSSELGMSAKELDELQIRLEPGN